MDNIYTVASSSSSTTYGNIMLFFKELLKTKFTPDFFKDIYVSSEISYVNIKRRLGRNTLNEFSKLERPFMTINPQIQHNNDMYLYDIPLTKNFDNMEYGIQKSTLFDVIVNKDDGYSLKYKLNRDQIQFEVSITIDTLIQQLDLYKYMLNHFVWDRPFTVKTSLESMIPKDIIYHLGLLSNIDITEGNKVPQIMKCMNRFSVYPITYKMRNGTSLDEFFMYYNAEVLITYSDLSVEQVNRKGMADDFYQITFRATVDFNLPGVFVLVGDKPRPKEMTVILDSKDRSGTSTLIPLYTINNLYAKYSATKNGFMLYTTTRFQTERDPKTKKDTLNMSVLFDQAYLDVIHKFDACNVPIETLVDIILIKDGEELLKNTDWLFDPHSMILTIMEADDNATYCALIYINNNLFTENIINDIEESKSDKPRI